jgi:excisionase family DNA binding protein
MPRTTKKPGSPSQSQSPTVPMMNGPMSQVLSLNEAAAYLRLAEPEVLRLVEEQGLPARRLGLHWRFLKSAIDAWLSMPLPRGQNQGIWAAAGALQDDPYLEEMLTEIDRLRGRPTSREG